MKARERERDREDEESRQQRKRIFYPSGIVSRESEVLILQQQ
jgi:hypothetical protein